MLPIPKRGFERAEFEIRMQKVQARMRVEKMDVILLTTEADVRYFTGFFTQFWESPTRPWFVLLPLEGKPIAVIPEIGAAGMAGTWVEDIHSWPAPRPKDDGISLLTNVILQLPRRFGRIGIPLGYESILRMPAGDYQRLRESLDAFDITDASLLLHQVRFVKSVAEIEKIHFICDLTSDAFEDLPQTLKANESERQNCKRMRIDLLERGADTTPYLISGSGPGGYDSIIMGPTDRIIEQGDVLIIDTGTTFDGYFCDFDRNFAFGHADDDVRRAYDVVYAATDVGFAACRPGATTSDVWAAMWSVMDAGGALGNSVGRLGHGLGMELTEWPSNTEDDMTPLEPGAVLTLEPGMEFAPGKQMVHEENIVITEGGARYLSRRALPELPIIG
ncbi:M24 family metallopeptidase [Sneathiella sp.]|uniref:M24 family metallopeptidase n=1 Tax=Sneathiella sp. TaxID=1964365 RepID=UPI00356894F0